MGKPFPNMHEKTNTAEYGKTISGCQKMVTYNLRYRCCYSFCKLPKFILIPMLQQIAISLFICKLPKLSMPKLPGSSLIAGLDCGLDRWTGLLDWIAGLDSEEKCRLACKTTCVVKTYASQGHMDVAEPRKRGTRVTINLNKAINYGAKLTKPVARQ